MEIALKGPKIWPPKTSEVIKILNDTLMTSSGFGSLEQPLRPQRSLLLFAIKGLKTWTPTTSEAVEHLASNGLIGLNKFRGCH